MGGDNLESTMALENAPARTGMRRRASRSSLDDRRTLPSRVRFVEYTASPVWNQGSGNREAKLVLRSGEGFRTGGERAESIRAGPVPKWCQRVNQAAEGRRGKPGERSRVGKIVVV